MPKLSDLGLTNEQVGEALDYTSMPDQMGASQPPPYPGTYRFKFPTDLSAVWEAFDHPNGKPPGKRIRARFDEAHPLTIIQSPGGESDGLPYMTSISNAERKRGKKDDPTAPFISDMDYILRDVFGQAQKPTGGNPGYAQSFMKLAAGAEMTADVTWSWKCNPNKAIFTDNGQGGLTEVPGQMGCNSAWYMKDIKEQQLMVPSDPNNPDSPKVYPLRITCSCGASVRAFANLERFRA